MTTNDENLHSDQQKLEFVKSPRNKVHILRQRERNGEVIVEEAIFIVHPNRITKQKTKEDIEIDQEHKKKVNKGKKDNKSAKNKVQNLLKYHEYAHLVKTAKRKQRQRKQKTNKQIDGSLTSNGEGILKICSNFCQELYHSQRKTQSHHMKAQNYQISHVVKEK